MGLRPQSVPPTWTAEDGARSWTSKALFPARDTPPRLSVFLAVAMCLALLVVLVDAVLDRAWVRLVLATLILGANAAVYVARVAVAVRR